VNSHRKQWPSSRLIQRHLYFIECESLIKIGCSKDVEKRLSDFQKWVPYPLRLLVTMPGTAREEAALHSLFSDEWSHAEWFFGSPRLKLFIADIASGHLPHIPEMPTSHYRLQMQAKGRQTRQRHKIIEAEKTQ
jgi:hypothetical protein